MIDLKREIEVHVVLVRSIYENNVGSVSRAMTNMGAHNLILIDPKCEITFAAQQMAARGQRPLQNRKVYLSWDDFFKNEPHGIRIATTTKDGQGRQVQDLGPALEKLKTHSPDLNKESEHILPIYLIFGPEDWGLSTEDLDYAHYACCIPTYGENVSMNLSQAVLLALFIYRQCFGGTRTPLEGKYSAKKKLPESVFPTKVMKDWLMEMGFDIRDRKISVYTVLKRMILHNLPTQKELRILETVLFQSYRKLVEYNEIRLKQGLPVVPTSTLLMNDPSKNLKDS